MNVLFAGTPVFAKQALSDILEAGFAVPLVFTQPDRPAGRGMKLKASAVKQLALERGLNIVQPQGLRLDGRFAADAALARAMLDAAQADVMVVAAYGLILPQWLLDVPKLGCINIHASLLPRWRGAAPIHRAIEACDAQTGITIMQMDAGLDTGDMLLARAIDIEREDTTATLHDRLAALGGAMVVEVLRQLQGGPMSHTVQPAHGITYAQKISKAEGRLDWSQPAETIRARVQAFSPAPGATMQLAGETIKVLACEIDSTTPNQGKRWGQILAIKSAGITVSCGNGALCLTLLQRAGGKPVSAADFARGASVQVGLALGGQQVPTALPEPSA